MAVKKQYKPVGFGDPPDPRTVDGMRLAAQQGAEMRRFNRIRKHYEENEQIEHGWLARVEQFMAWCLTHMKFRSWFSR